jgi:hypothetical protein
MTDNGDTVTAMMEHDHSVHAPDAFRITKISYNKLVAEHGEDSDIAEAALTADQLLELASCPVCHLGVPMLAATLQIVPQVSTEVLLHLVAALARANAMVVKGSENYSNLDPEMQEHLRAAAGLPPRPDFVPES